MSDSTNSYFCNKLLCSHCLRPYRGHVLCDLLGLPCDECDWRRRICCCEKSSIEKYWPRICHQNGLQHFRYLYYYVSSVSREINQTTCHLMVDIRLNTTFFCIVKSRTPPLTFLPLAQVLQGRKQFCWRLEIVVADQSSTIL